MNLGRGAGGGHRCDENSALQWVQVAGGPLDILSLPRSHHLIERHWWVYADICLHNCFLSFFCEVSKTVSTAEQQLWKKSFSCFEKGIHNFESIDDVTNAALLLCNTGRLMRICAQAHCGAGDEFKREFSPEEGLYYNKVTCLHVGPHLFTPDCPLHFATAPLKGYKTKIINSCGDGTGLDRSLKHLETGRILRI